MPRTARSIVADHCYHLINRGNNRARVFHDNEDYFAFLALIAEGQTRFSLPILALCLMPNHVHLVVCPKADDDLARWTQWLFTTHVRRYHKKYGSSGRVWQGRFKAFLIQEDAHLLTVMRYVERNALRAGLVKRAERWRWGSLHWRNSKTPKVPLSPSPVPLPSDWDEWVNSPQTAAELESVRTCVNRQRPFGTQAWVERKARELNLGHSLHPIGRPKPSGAATHLKEMGTFMLRKWKR
jgi:putative transposase